MIRRLRAWPDPPLVALSGPALAAEKTKALDLGADDFLTKPFGMGEIVARRRVALRQCLQAKATRRELGEPGMLEPDAPVSGRTFAGKLLPAAEHHETAGREHPCADSAVEHDMAEAIGQGVMNKSIRHALFR